MKAYRPIVIVLLLSILSIQVYVTLFRKETFKGGDIARTASANFTNLASNAAKGVVNRNINSLTAASQGSKNIAMADQVQANQQFAAAVNNEVDSMTHLALANAIDTVTAGYTH